MTNSTEQALITEIQNAIKAYKKIDTYSNDRDNCDYFESAAVPIFQRLANDAALLIEKQGVNNTCEPLLNLAAGLKQYGEVWGDTGWSHTSLCFAFEKALAKTGDDKQNRNPFLKIKL